MRLDIEMDGFALFEMTRLEGHSVAASYHCPVQPCHIFFFQTREARESWILLGKIA